MTEKKREGFAPPALGGSSLLVVFAVLALTVFALLSLSTVRADVRLGDAAAKAVSDYYTADAQAQEILAQLRNGETPVEVTTHTEDSWTRMTRSTWGFMEILSISTQAVSPTRPKMVHPTPLVIPTSRSIRLNRSTRRSMSS